MFKEQADLLEGGTIVVVATPAGAHQVIDVRRAHRRLVQKNLKNTNQVLKIVFSLIINN